MISLQGVPPFPIQRLLDVHNQLVHVQALCQALQVFPTSGTQTTYFTWEKWRYRWAALLWLGGRKVNKGVPLLEQRRVSVYYALGIVLNLPFLPTAEEDTRFAFQPAVPAQQSKQLKESSTEAPWKETPPGWGTANTVVHFMSTETLGCHLW